MRFLKRLLGILPLRYAYAHCDIPCGIYDPHAIQLAVHSIIRMNQLILDAKKDEMGEAKYVSHIARLTKVKEEHAEQVKHEARVLWGDYFKPEMIEKFPDLHSLIFEIMHQASKARQAVDLEIAQELLVKVQMLAEIFYQTKNVSPIRVPSLYPTQGEIVVYQEK